MTDESGGALSTLRSARAAGPDRQRRREALGAARQRYKRLSAAGKRKLLDELELLTGYHRKSEVDGFYWTVLVPDIVNSGREEQDSVSV